LAGVPIDEAFYRIIGAVRELPQDMQAARLSLIGGTDSMKKWLPLLTRSEEELRAMAKASSFTSETMNAARDATQAQQKATVAFSNAWAQVAVALAPAVTWIADNLTPMLKDLGKWLGENKRLVAAVFGGVAAVMALGAALVGIGGTIAILTIAIGGLASLFAAVFSPVGLGIAALAVAGTMLVAMAADFGVLEEAVNSLSVTFSKTWEGIQNAIAAGDLKLAMSIAIAGLKVVWEEFLLWFTRKWRSNLDLIADTATTLGRLLADPRELSGAQMGALLPRGVLDEQAANRAARKVRDKGLGAGVAAAREELDRLTKQAGDQRFGMMGMRLALAGLAAIHGQARQLTVAAKAMQETFGGTRGQFGGQGLAAALGIGGGTIPEKQLKEQEEMNDRLGRIEKKVGGINAE
jgi:hypothetical protein